MISHLSEGLLSRKQRIIAGNDVEKLNPLCTQYKILQLLQKMVWQFPKELKTEFPHDPIIPLLDIYPKELKASLKVMFVQTCLEQHHSYQLKCGSNRVHQQMSGQQNMVYSYKGILFSLKQEGIYDICYNIDKTLGIMLTEISQSQKYIE